LQNVLEDRFIPAGAGNSRGRQATADRISVHPRGRGEQEQTTTHKDGYPGSSPRARGTGDQPLSAHQKRRFIPAGAGNSCPGPHRRSQYEVHPRGRGEQLRFVDEPEPVVGSSPRARGTETIATLICQRKRFIPAGAGNRSLHPN